MEKNEMPIVGTSAAAPVQAPVAASNVAAGASAAAPVQAPVAASNVAAGASAAAPVQAPVAASNVAAGASAAATVQSPVDWDPYEPVQYDAPENPYDTTIVDNEPEVQSSDVDSDDESFHTKTRHVLRSVHVAGDAPVNLRPSFYLSLVRHAKAQLRHQPLRPGSTSPVVVVLDQIFSAMAFLSQNSAVFWVKRALRPLLNKNQTSSWMGLDPDPPTQPVSPCAQLLSVAACRPVAAQFFPDAEPGQIRPIDLSGIYKCPFCNRKLRATDFNSLVNHAESIGRCGARVGRTVNVHAYMAKHKALGIHLRNLQASHTRYLEALNVPTALSVCDCSICRAA
ncbi:hypothetical protein QYE76_011230 [Lolium multiflorum]|uniref:Uncharacterized protein n=1 Tax=Lolium multiflorum TaxID=4521 RepID=A0AAD8X2K1_LOLMU|nr:hypothetical protein QYE76_011230 [Lolium multiflorum]